MFTFELKNVAFRQIVFQPAVVQNAWCRFCSLLLHSTLKIIHVC